MKKILTTALMVILITLLAACGTQSESSNDEENNSASEETPQTEEQTEDLSPEEVITKSSETMSEWSGMHYVMDGDQTINASKGDQEHTFNQNFSMETEMTMDPMTMYMSGSMELEGQEMPIESYYKDSTMYTNAGTGQWLGVEGMNMEELQGQMQGQDASQTMEQFSSIVHAVSDEGNTEDAIAMEEQDNMYVVTIELNEEASSEVLDMIKEQSNGAMQQLKQFGIPNVMERMQIKEVKQTLFVDKETFEQNKMEQQMTMELTHDDAIMTFDVNMNLDIKGTVEEEITIPEDVKDQAQIMSMEQFQGAQQPQ